MTRAYVALGSNIEPEANIRAAVVLIAEREHVVAVSTFYRTPPVATAGPAFINGVLALETCRPPLELKLGVLREVEARLGRTRGTDRNAPRTIDCDLLTFDDEILRNRDLVIPSPDIEERWFVAIPLCELAPSLILPGSRRALVQVCTSMPRQAMSPLADLTAEVRRELKELHHGSSPRRISGSTTSR